MVTIIDKIRLRPGIDRNRFERWVRQTDYAACHELASIASFSVVQVSTGYGAPFHYVEVIQATSAEAFAADVATPRFQALVAAFGEMAEVVETVEGELIEPGYARAR